MLFEKKLALVGFRFSWDSMISIGCIQMELPNTLPLIIFQNIYIL